MKTWKLLKNWYEGGCGNVKLDSRLSDCFPVSNGVRHKLVLSAALFFLVMDPLLRDLYKINVWHWSLFYAGGFLHANDIQTLALSETL